MDAITLCGGHSVGVFLMERMVCGLGENEWVTPDNDGLLSRKMTVGRFMESKNVG